MTKESEIRTPPVRELEVIRLIASGLKDSTIARRLGVSVVTVRRRSREFRQRVGAATRSEAVAMAAARGWLSMDRAEPDEQQDEETATEIE